MLPVVINNYGYAGLEKPIFEKTLKKTYPVGWVFFPSNSSVLLSSSGVFTDPYFVC